jgi:hypothetical protein
MINTIPTLGNSYTTLASCFLCPFPQAPYSGFSVQIRPFHFLTRQTQPQNNHRLRNRKLNLFFGSRLFWIRQLESPVGGVDPAWIEFVRLENEEYSFLF